ncbi:MAG: tRNA (guanosine(37)-N1)-methyltransferase TrmD [Rubrobacteraceae bacterium]
MDGIDVFCVFPQAVNAMLGVGVVGRAIERGVVEYRSFDLREYAPNGRIDDAPFGGGAGMVVRVDVVARALEAVYEIPVGQVREERRVVLTEPGGRRLTQEYAREVAEGRDLTVICGRYGGVDERIRTEFATETVSLGDFVLSGGEIAAAALADSVVRLRDGVLGNSESLVGESFAAEESIGPPVYTRPADWNGKEVPGVLLSGNHAEIRAWRERESRARAQERAAKKRRV